MSNLYSCPQCELPVRENQNSIYCESCDSWIHLRCSGLSIQRFKELGNDTSSLWFCKNCIADALPVGKLSQRHFLSEISPKKNKDNAITDFFRSCPICYKRVNNIEKAAPCYHCRCYIHRKCSFLSDKELSNLGIIRQQWFCVNCANNIFPFNSTNSHDILSDSFNSNELCNDASKDLTDYNCLENITELKLDKLNLNHFHPNADNDIDQNLNFTIDFKYYITHKFHKLSRNFNSNHLLFFGLMHTNICSLNKNFNNLEILTTSLQHKFDIIALSETRITTNNDLNSKNIALNGYQQYVGTSGKSMKWGCGFFISNELSFIPREDLNICYSNNNSEFEANWIEIQSQNNKNFLIAVIYRHPRKRKDTEFLDYLTNSICRGHSISNHLTPVTMMSWNCW